MENGVTNVRMQSILDLHSTDIGRILSSLVEENMLLADRKGRWTSYRINLNYEMLSEQYQMSDMQQTEIEFRNETDRIIYEYVCANGFITTAQVQQITRIKTSQGASVALNRLISKQLLKMVRNGKNVTYELDKR